MEDYEMDYTTFLFANPSLLEGAARVLDLGGTLEEYNVSADGEEADRRAFLMDQRAVGSDLRKAMRVVAERLGIERGQE